MTVELRDVSSVRGAEVHLSDISLSLERGTLNVLLGPTLVRQDIADARDGRAAMRRPRAASWSTART